MLRAIQASDSAHRYRAKLQQDWEIEHKQLLAQEETERSHERRKTMKDKLGQELQAGDYVAYAGRHSSSLWIKIGKIVKIEVREHWGHTDTIAIIWAVEQFFNGEFQRQLQKSQVSNNHLMIKLFDMQVPEEIRTILESLTITTPNETWVHRNSEAK